jgi:hypothetical protein
MPCTHGPKGSEDDTCVFCVRSDIVIERLRKALETQVAVNADLVERLRLAQRGNASARAYVLSLLAHADGVPVLKLYCEMIDALDAAADR